MSVMKLIQLLPRWCEFLVVCGLCWGLFALHSVSYAISATEAPVLNNEHFLYLIATELGLAAAAFLFLRFRGWSIKDFPIHITWTTTGAGILLLLIDLLLNSIAYDLGQALGGSVKPLSEITRTISVSMSVAIVVSLVNGAFEELFLVGYVFKALEHHGLAFTLGVSAFLRMLAHVYQGPVGALSILFMGIFSGLVYWRFRQLWPLILAHIAADFLALAL